VQEVARKYFGEDSLTVAVLDPQPMSGRAGASSRAEAGSK
jgi:hypothetical protein